MCRLILREADFTEDFSTVVTEVGKAHLLLFAQFVTTGTVPVTSLDPETVSAFQNLGVHLDQMKLETSFQIKKEMCEETPTNNGDTKHELSKTGLPATSLLLHYFLIVDYENSFSVSSELSSA